MKLIFLSVATFIYGYFCDICLGICEKNAKNKLEKGKSLTGMSLVFMSNLANNSFLRWQRMENKLICLLTQEQNF